MKTKIVSYTPAALPPLTKAQIANLKKLWRRGPTARLISAMLLS